MAGLPRKNSYLPSEGFPQLPMQTLPSAQCTRPRPHGKGDLPLKLGPGLCPSLCFPKLHPQFWQEEGGNVVPSAPPAETSLSPCFALCGENESGALAWHQGGKWNQSGVLSPFQKCSQIGPSWGWETLGPMKALETWEGRGGGKKGLGDRTRDPEQWRAGGGPSRGAPHPRKAQLPAAGAAPGLRSSNRSGVATARARRQQPCCQCKASPCTHDFQTWWLMKMT